MPFLTPCRALAVVGILGFGIFLSIGCDSDSESSASGTSLNETIHGTCDYGMQCLDYTALPVNQSAANCIAGPYGIPNNTCTYASGAKCPTTGLRGTCIVFEGYFRLYAAVYDLATATQYCSAMQGTWVSAFTSSQELSDF